MSERGGGMSRLTRIAIPVLGLAGMGVAAYLTVTHYQSSDVICLFNAKCDAVLSSSYSTIWNIPLSLFGLVMYAVITILGALMLRSESEWEHMIALGVYATALAGMVFTGYLYSLEIFVLHAFCSWCIISSIILALIFVLSIFNFFSIQRRLKDAPHTRAFRIRDYVRW